jgi:transcriptional regulator with XRE-family HTH domain
MIPRDARMDFSVLRELRHRSGLTLEQVAERTGISFATLSRVESNRNDPSLDTLIRLAACFGLSAANLLDLAGTHVVEFAHESIRRLGTAKRRVVRLTDTELILVEATAVDGLQPPHNHPGQYQLMWVLDGSAALTVGDQEHVLGPGDAMKFDAGLTHSARFTEDTSYVVVLVPRRVR